MPLPAWAVSAALLHRARRPLAVSDLTEQVMATKLSGLGMRGGKTPDRTLRTQLVDQKSTPPFFSINDGLVTLVDPSLAAMDITVAEAIRALDALPSVMPLSSDMRERLQDDVDAILNDESLGSADRARLVCARVGQGAFRVAVLEHWGDRCAVTGSATPEVIRASHIKPWRESDKRERLDPYNGLPLVASLDALFDAGLISFDADGTGIRSPRLADTECGILGITDFRLRDRPSDSTARYLEYHRATVFNRKE